MQSIDILSLRALMQALERIHSTVDLVVLPNVLFSALKELVPDATVTLEELDLATGIVTSHQSEDCWSQELKARLVELMPTHPVVPAYKAGRRGAIPVTDCITQRQFRETPQYRDVLLPVGLRYQTVVTLEAPRKIAGMTVIRNKDFTATEAVLLQLIAPQITVAHRNAQAFARMKAMALETIPSPDALEHIGLTPREAEVLHWVIQGKRDCEIAKFLGASVRTIQNHLRSIFLKLRVETRTAAVLEANERVKRIAMS
jgi:DNA-binding CsgD family transcriptional regulator